MLHAYVGIASQQGLESLHLEESHTATFLLRQIGRPTSRGQICFWTVVAPELAAQVQEVLATGQRAAAWLLLESFAFEIGRILPDSSIDGVASIE